MTCGTLIEILKVFDTNIKVIISTSQDWKEPIRKVRFIEKADKIYKPYEITEGESYIELS